VIVCSDTISAGQKEDQAGKAIISKLEAYDIAVSDYIVIPDDKNLIQEKAKHYENQGVDLIIFTGGTGLSTRDNTPEALNEIIDRKIPGIEEAIRSYGQERTPYAMLSRSVVGTINNSIVLALPGSTNGAKESMDAIFPSILHAFGVLKGARHDA
jgi:molybdenum cofactor synthesis domain-containing protein